MSAVEQALNSNAFSAFANELNPQSEDSVFRKLRTFETQGDLDAKTEDVRKRFSDSRMWMGRLYPRMTRQYKTYRSIAEQLKDKLGRPIKNRPNLYIPYPWAMVESEIPRLAGRLPRIHAFPRQAINRAKVEVIQNNTAYSFDQMEFIYKQVLWMRQAAIYGWSPLFYFWRKEVRTALARRLLSPNMDPGNEDSYGIFKQEATIHDHFDCTVLDVWDTFMQPNVEEPDAGDWIGFRQWMSRKDIENRVDQGVFYEETLDSLDNGGMIQGQEEGRSDRDELANLQRDISQSSYGRHEVFFLLEADAIYTLIDRKVLARWGDNPHPKQEIPIVNYNPMPMISEPIGISSIDALAGLPNKLNATSNAAYANLSLFVNGIFLAKRHADTDLNNLVFSPGNIILTGDMSSVKQLEVQDTSQQATRAIIETKEEMQFAGGVSDYTAGVPTSAREANTATGVTTIVREANARFSLKLIMFESRPLRRLLKACHAYNMTYQPVEQMIYVHGPDGYLMANVRLEEILCDCDFMVEPGSSAPQDQLSRRDSLTSLLDRAMKATSVIDQRKYWLEVLEAHDISNAADMLMKQPDDMTMAKDMQLIEAENISLLNGQDVVLAGNDQLHLMGHTELESDPRFRDMPAAAKVAYFSHIEQHSKRLAQERAQASMTSRNATLFGGGANGPQPAAPAAGAVPGLPDANPAGAVPAPQGAAG